MVITIDSNELPKWKVEKILVLLHSVETTRRQYPKKQSADKLSTGAIIAIVDMFNPDFPLSFKVGKYFKNIYRYFVYCYSYESMSTSCSNHPELLGVNHSSIITGWRVVSSHLSVYKANKELSTIIDNIDAVIKNKIKQNFNHEESKQPQK
jgi:hypothetical protein